MAKEITLEEEIKELERELKVRERVYPEWSKGPNPKLKPAEAERRMNCFKKTIERLKNIQAAQLASQGTQTTLFS